MEILWQVIKKLGWDCAESFTVTPNFGGYFKGVKCVKEFSPSQIKLQLNKQTVNISGDGLCIGKFFEGDIIIEGKILGVSVE
jgi:hypothetical protein